MGITHETPSLPSNATGFWLRQIVFHNGIAKYRAIGPDLLLDLGRTAQQTSPASGDETNFLPRDGISRNCGGFADMLMISSSVRMVDGVHSHTTSTRPAVALGLVFEERTASLHERLVNTPAASNNSDRSASSALNRLLGSTRQPNTGDAVIVVANDGGVVSRCPCKRSTISRTCLEVAADGSFGHLAQREDVPDGKLGLLANIDKGASVHALGSDKDLILSAMLVRVLELDTGERSATARVVNNLLDYTPHVAVSLREVELPELGRSLVVVGMGFEDGMCLSLCANDATHGRELA